VDTSLVSLNLRTVRIHERISIPVSCVSNLRDRNVLEIAISL
jgi:hypothetical protein